MGNGDYRGYYWLLAPLTKLVCFANRLRSGLYFNNLSTPCSNVIG